jgi:hypothetical protein
MKTCKLREYRWAIDYCEERGKGVQSSTGKCRRQEQCRGGGAMVGTMDPVLPKASIDNSNGQCRNKSRGCPQGIRFSRISNMKTWKLRNCRRCAADFCEERKDGEGKGKK